MRMLTTALLLGCLSAAGSAAGNEDRAAPEVAEPQKEEDSGLVCRKIPQIGSRIPQRVCRSRAEIEAERLDGKNWTNRTQDSMPTSGGLPPGVSPG